MFSTLIGDERIGDKNNIITVSSNGYPLEKEVGEVV